MRGRVPRNGVKGVRVLSDGPVPVGMSMGLLKGVPG